MTQIDLAGNPPNIREAVIEEVTVVTQEFERGEMYWFAPGKPEANGIIFVLMDTTGQWWRGEDTWDGESKPDVRAPAGLLTPGGGFGKVWMEQGFESIVGFATGGEQVIEGWYKASADGWQLRVDGACIELPADKQWTPEPAPEPEPEPEPAPNRYWWWVWLDELDMPVNLFHVVWIGADRLRIGSHDIVLSLPEATATALRAYVKARCVEII